jgi:hypothetical protein
MRFQKQHCLNADAAYAKGQKIICKRGIACEDQVQMGKKVICKQSRVFMRHFHTEGLDGTRKDDRRGD